MFIRTVRTPVRYAFTLAVVALATLLRLALANVLGAGVPVILYYPAVVVCAWFGGLGQGLLATGLSCLIAWYVFIPIYRTLTLPESTAPAQLLVFLVSGILISLLAENLRRSRRRTEESEAQERSRRETLHVTLSSIGDAVIATDAQGLVTFMNRVAEELTAWTQNEAVGRPLTEVFHIVDEQTRQVAESPGAKVIREGTIVGLANPTALIARDGAEKLIDDTAAPIRDNEGRLIGTVLVFRDVTERRRSELALAQLGAIVASSEDAIVGKNLDGVITSWNAGAERIFGYSAAEVKGQHITVIIPPDRHAEETGILERLKRGERIEHYETVRVRKDGRFISVSLTISPIKDKAGRIVGAAKIARDITGRKQAEQEREQLLAREQATRAAAEAARQRSAFLSQASQLLASTLDYETTLKSVAQLVVPQFADWCLVYLTGVADSLQRVTSAHQDPAKIEFAEAAGRRYPPDPNDLLGVAKVLRTGEAKLYSEITDEQLIQAARDAEHLELLRAAGLKSAMIVPLVARGRTLGAITLVTGESGRRYTEEDQAFAQDLAHRAALAVDNARLYREAAAALREREQALELHRQVERQLTTLVEASNTLLGSLRLDEVQQAILDLSSRLISADAYAVWRKEPRNETWRIVAATGLSEPFQATILSGANLTTPQLEGALAIESVIAVPWLKHRQEAYQHEGIASFLAIPLVLHGHPEGTITFYYRQAHSFTEMEIRVATALANLAAAAIRSSELYQEQRELRKRAEEASRQKDEFLATVSHELRTPLNSMFGWIRMLRSRRLDAATTARALETIEQSARAQNALIEDILDVSRIITGRLRLNPQTVDVLSLLDAALDSVRPTAEAKGVQLDSEFDPAVGVISGDPQRLQQIVWNLLSNAIKFTPKGGRVELRLVRSDAEIEVIVSDTGIGIRPDFLPYVFDRFRQADNSSSRVHGGLGLGLAIVRHLVELHGGSVAAESPGEGKGATFKVVLPTVVVRQELNPLQINPGAAQANELLNLPFDLKGLRVLVVDDNEAARDLLTTTLRQSGAEAQSAASAAEALLILDAWQPNILVSDISMPVEDGYALIRKVRERGPERGGEIPAVALTAYAKSEDRLRALAEGYQMHVAKPADPVELAAVIASLTGRLGRDHKLQGAGDRLG